MPIRKFPYDVAARNRKANRYSKWSAGNPDLQLDRPTLASRRIGAAFLETEAKPSAKISQSDGIFTVGSCFAREIEDKLKGRGFSILSRDDDLANDPLFFSDGRLREGYYNRYNTPSMLLDFETALGARELGKTDLMLEVEPNKFFDMHYTRALEEASLDTCLHRRRVMQALVRRVSQAKAIVLTLGLNEAWFDTKTGCYLNIAPKVVKKGDVSAYECHILSVADNVAALNGIHALLMKAVGPDFHLFVTVSPVPFDLTFAPEDAIVANSESKSILRAAAAEFCATQDNVHYFQSYEIAMYSDRGATWKQDHRHVTTPAVTHITDLFIRDCVA